MRLQVLVGAATILPTGLGGSCVRGRNTGETWKPGQAEACPHTAAMTQHGRHKKAPAVVQGRLVHAPSLPTGSYARSRDLP